MANTKTLRAALATCNYDELANIAALYCLAFDAGHNVESDRPRALVANEILEGRYGDLTWTIITNAINAIQEEFAAA